MKEKTVVTPYNDAEAKKAQVERMFDNIAPRYDLLNRVLSLGIDVQWRKKALNYLRELAPQSLLDVATGTADVAIMAARQLSPKQVVGIDIANQMLDIGREKIRKAGWQEVISLETGDSENLRFADNSFDAVTVAFGVRNFENLEKGLSEMCRVLRPGGRVVILEFSKPGIFPIKQLYNSYFKYVLPLIGRLTSRDVRAYTYLFESVQAFPEGRDFLNILSKTGYQNPQCERLTLGICSIYTATK
ncbi:MAG TPA: bifunctional demethylmenaquinone methyltransferase/2-methoxy-6-polyprenyl-1,4-benzoquinol methylase UbiE [Saprospiraceae bacterium]|nr:bifunctional demethylmenaquinone methyltransferase/2-methoxy-6-polyprenyl-1,4-benzoquinol methylase UbiE [Saprospiraceae bacterium]HNM24774.1 bifunctional demethylmenaquinone methyltransferase/2-methoxy-6-polyprenyl-1,4-benzoquinol methylase UbiE [Saprospiraceae bacterium]